MIENSAFIKEVNDKLFEIDCKKNKPNVHEKLLQVSEILKISNETHISKPIHLKHIKKQEGIEITTNTIITPMKKQRFQNIIVQIYGFENVNTYTIDLICYTKEGERFVIQAYKENFTLLIDVAKPDVGISYVIDYLKRKDVKIFYFDEHDTGKKNFLDLVFCEENVDVHEKDDVDANKVMETEIFPLDF